jgi:DNA-directed RNA polymerase specialized sigma54-like protein
VQHLDPAGVGARDLRECLLIQIAAQQHEFNQVYARQAIRVRSGSLKTRTAAFRAEAEAQLEERRRSMEVAALIVDRTCICCRSAT